MRNKIKCLAYLLFLSIPLLSSAQYSPASGNGKNAIDTSSLSSLTSNFIFWVLGGLGLLSFIGLFIAGLDLIAAASDEDRVTRGKRTLIFSIVGLIISILGIIILSYTLQYLG